MKSPPPIGALSNLPISNNWNRSHGQHMEYEASNRRSDASSVSSDDGHLTQAARRQSHSMAPSRLLLLPAELRLELWELALQEQFALGIGASYTITPLAPKVFGGDAVKQATQPPLTQVSRQVRGETLALFYRLNTFILAIHYRLARAQVDEWIDYLSANPKISINIRHITIKHRFGILDFRGTIDFDFKDFRILGPKLWYNAIPPLTRKRVERIMDDANKAERTSDLITLTLRQLVELLGIEAPTRAALMAS